MLNIDEEYGYLKVESLEDLEERYRALTEERSSCERFLQNSNIRTEAKNDVYNDLMYFDDLISHIELIMQEKKNQKII
ncbi:MAG: hypothetical protein IKE63_04700 [Bacilli bacterium]|nr:hypothetical protein [Bacilli bacterium]